MNFRSRLVSSRSLLVLLVLVASLASVARSHPHLAHSHEGAAACPVTGHKTAPVRTWESKLIEAAVASVLTSAVPLLIILVMPLNARFLGISMAFGAGGILCDALTHIAHAPEGAMLYVCIGVGAAYTLEALLGHGGHCAAGGRDAAAARVAIVADAAHNYSDGLAIGAAFLSGGARRGWQVAMGVMLHEVPHELGDVALGMRGGWSRWTAASVQLLTACANVLGCASVFMMPISSDDFELVVEPLMTGAFLYLAIASMLGSLQHEHRPLWVRLAECSAFSFGTLLVHQAHAHE